MLKIPIYQPSIKGNEKKYVDECLDTNWISSKGRFVAEFERGFAGYVGARHAAAVCNGTVALHLALLALGIGPGDEVVVPTLTYIASVNAITYTGARPVFVDSLPDTWQMDPEDVRRKVTDRTRAVMAVHLYGQPCDMDALTGICREGGLFLVEDCAEAFGTQYKGRHVGTFGHVATFSLYGNKTITSGEGGVVVTDDEGIHGRAVHLKGQGLSDGREYWHDVVGYNYRMTNVCAAIALAQLEQAERIISAKRTLAGWYAKGLDGLPVVMHGETGDARHSYWMCSILAGEPSLRDRLRASLADAGIETRPVFFPAHTMPMYFDGSLSLPVAEDIASRGINLPSWPDLTREQVEYVCGVIADFFGGSGEAGGRLGRR